MAKWPDLAAGFKLLREVDLNAIRRQAELPFHLAVLGGTGAGKSLLIDQLLRGTRSLLPGPILPAREYDLEGEMPVGPGTLALLMIDPIEDDYTRAQDVFRQLVRDRIPVVVCYLRQH